MQDNQRIFVLGVDMENRSAEDIARDAAQQIAKITDALIAKQNQEKADKLAQEGKSEKNDSNII